MILDKLLSISISRKVVGIVLITTLLFAPLSSVLIHLHIKKNFSHIVAHKGLFIASILALQIEKKIAINNRLDTVVPIIDEILERYSSNHKEIIDYHPLAIETKP